MACDRAEGFNLEVLLREPDSPECRDFVAHCASCTDCAAALQRHDDPPPTSIRPRPKLLMTAAAVVILATIALLALSDRSGEAPKHLPADTERAGVPAEPRPDRATSQHIAENGRLSLSLAELPVGESLPLNLRMPDEARSEGTRPVRVVDVERQRMLETTGAVVSGADTGLQIEIDPDWLRPGLYMIEVDTAEKRPLALRRYVLELH